MSIAQRITKRMEATGRTRSKDSIYAVAMDDHNVLCLTESHLDVWWHSLKPEEKAVLYEAHLDGRIGNDDETLAWAESRLRGYAALSECAKPISPLVVRGGTLDDFKAACGRSTEEVSHVSQ